jgi:phosphoribosylglycinamide formyltransferase-1
MKRIVVFASGEGTNAQRLIDYFRGKDVEVSLIISNNPDANVLKRAEKSGIPSLLINKEGFYKKEEVLKRLLAENPDLIICAGFLWKVPVNIVHAFPNKVINIHPALLPKYGGKGMYGSHVHKAVIEAGEKESGITIHYLNENYDEGKIIFQAKCEVKKEDTPETLAQKVHALEYEYFPTTIEKILK